MSTANINAVKPSLAWRFAWKEYRSLRGLWVAGFMIALLVQVGPLVFGGTQADLGASYLIAWVAAALFAVGAAITVFSGETEDGTRDYLRLLAGDWKPMFAVKVLMSFVGAAALGCALSVVAWLLLDYQWPGPSYARLVFGIAGVAIVEGLSWSLLFSLWWKHPLLAAVSGIAAASFGAQLAIHMTTNAHNTWTADAYVDAAPGRLAICLAVFAVDMLLGRRWLYPQAAAPRRQRVVTPAKPANGIARPRRKMFTRLLWQTWRESWRSILVIVPLSLGLLVAAAGILEQFARLHDFGFMYLIPPALMGALVFRADWQQDHRLFLATRAAWPRYVWLSRQVVWLGSLVLLSLIVQFAGSWMMQSELTREVTHHLRGDWYSSWWLGREYSTEESPWTQAWRFEQMQRDLDRAVLTAWCAVLGAYGVGQLCSMLLRQSLLAGFLAVLFSLMLGGWSVLMFLWQMNPLWFVLPVGLAALLATWFRAPSWILGKNHGKFWLAPTAALVLPLVGVATMIPSTRMAQLLDRTRGHQLYNIQSWEWNQHYVAVRNNADATALRYEQLGSQLEELLEPLPGSPAGRDRMETLSHLAEEVGQLTREPYCRFPQEHALAGSISGQYLQNLQKLLASEGQLSLVGGDFDDAFERICDRIRLINHRLQFQSSSIYTSVLANKSEGTWSVFDDLIAWANHPDQTSERILDAIPKLRGLFDATPQPTDAIKVDRNDIRGVVLEKEVPNYGSSGQLALALNRLPGEQERALVATDILTTHALRYAAEVQLNTLNTAVETDHAEVAATALRDTVRTTPWTSTYAILEKTYRRDFQGFSRANELAHACASSFLVAELFDRSGNFQYLLQTWVEEETRRRALLMQLALIAYRIDHDEYPESLDELTPDYLPEPINDPFSGKPFVYRPEGLDLPLRKAVYNSAIGEDQYIPVGTPLMWSVGNGISELVEEFEYDPGQQQMAGLEEANVEPEAGFGQSGYRFLPTERGGHGRPNLVFPLGKINAAKE